MKQRTLSIIKPDAVAAGKAGKIIAFTLIERVKNNDDKRYEQEQQCGVQHRFRKREHGIMPLPRPARMDCVLMHRRLFFEGASERKI